MAEGGHVSAQRKSGWWNDDAREEIDRASSDWLRLHVPPERDFSDAACAARAHMTVTGETNADLRLCGHRCSGGHDTIAIVTRMGATFHVDADNGCAECLIAMQQAADAAPGPDP